MDLNNGTIAATKRRQRFESNTSRRMNNDSGRIANCNPDGSDCLTGAYDKEASCQYPRGTSKEARLEEMRLRRRKRIERRSQGLLLRTSIEASEDGNEAMTGLETRLGDLQMVGKIPDLFHRFLLRPSKQSRC